MGLFLGGCTQSFFYNRLDTLFNWYVDDYVELNKVQQENFDVRLDAILEWHRKVELPRYVNFLTQIETDINQTVDGEILDAWINQALNAYELVENEMTQLFLSTGDELTQEQVDLFIDNLWKKHEDNKEKYLSRSNNE
ncbi:MAG: DUF6279 family lipoprotein, partial [Pseudomonadota bacterium]